MNSLTEQLHALELRLASPDARESPESPADLLADDFLEFGSRGRIYDKAQALAAMQMSSPRIDIEDFHVRELGPDLALATYRARSASGHSLRSSIWRREGDAWRVVFHQGTPIRG